MLIIANGAFKSGSSWLYQALRHLTGFGSPPASYVNPAWRHPSIAPGQLAACLRHVDVAQGQYLCKNHFGDRQSRDLILAHPQVKVIGIKRHTADVVVSAYYHYRRIERYSQGFETYYWRRGRRVAAAIRAYHQVWDVPSPQVYSSSYEALKGDFNAELGAIAQFLHIPADADQIEQIRQQTSFDTMKQASKSGHVRKGIVGDWLNHLTPPMVEDLAQIEAHGLSPVSLWWGAALDKLAIVTTRLAPDPAPPPTP